MKKELMMGIIGILIGAIVSGVGVYTLLSRSEVKTTPEIASVSDSHLMPDGTRMGNMQKGMTMDGMTEVLIGKKGDDFDKEFITQMIDHHEGAVDMANLALKNAKHQEIKDFSERIIDAQTTEIEQMKSWEASWGY